MANFIEDLQKTRIRRQRAAKLAEDAMLINKAKKKKEVDEFNEQFFLIAKQALEDTGIELALQEIATNLNEEGGRVENNYRSLLYDKEYRPITTRALEEKIDSVYIGLGWWGSILSKNEKDGRVWINKEYNAICVVFHANGSLEFMSSVGDMPSYTPDRYVDARSRFLSRRQWSRNNNLVAQVLEETYHSPAIKIIEITLYEPSVALDTDPSHGH